jgi:RNase P subunit RPR2
MSDSEIKANRTISTKALLNNHKDGNVKRRKTMKEINEKFLDKLEKIDKRVVCTKCEMMFSTDAGLERHIARRGHVQ